MKKNIKKKSYQDKLFQRIKNVSLCIQDIKYNILSVVNLYILIFNRNDIHNDICCSL